MNEKQKKTKKKNKKKSKKKQKKTKTKTKSHKLSNEKLLNQNFTNKMETYLDFNKKYKILKKHI
jgi:hypothetical protein